MSFCQVNDTSFHEFICIFTAMLVSRSCFSLEDLIYHALLPALCDAVDSGSVYYITFTISCPTSSARDFFLLDLGISVV